MKMGRRRRTKGEKEQEQEKGRGEDAREGIIAGTAEDEEELHPPSAQPHPNKLSFELCFLHFLGF